ncbi:MAG: curved DNA-binding protein CbpA [Flammeovirgaceae bacterium]|jgi:curved DNA-binding protein CbpA
MKDYYYILGLQKTATQAEIKMAYRKLSNKFHPDKNNGDTFFEERFKEIQEAYEVLSDSSRKSTYDYRQSAQSKQGGQTTNYSTFTPEIEYFRANKNSVEYEEEITFSWKVINADKVTLKPFGKVNPIGEKTVKLKDFKNEILVFKILAENTVIARSAESILEIKNSTYDEIYQNIKASISAKEEKAHKNETTTDSSTQESEHRPDYMSLAIFVLICLLLLMFALGT